MSLEILQIVPRLPPAINGVGDYATLLAKQLLSDHRVSSRFLVCDPTWHGDSELDGFPVARLQRREANHLAETLTRNNLPRIALLHYVGYGYQGRGCPSWLVDGLKLWKRADSEHELVTMFHELFAFGPPWRSSFWTSYTQRRLAADLAKDSNSCVTNMRQYANWLGRRAYKHLENVPVIPVFSTIGEGKPKESTPLNGRPPQMVIFGGEIWVNELLRKQSGETYRCCDALGIERIVTVGSPLGTAPRRSRIPIDELGYLRSDRVVEVIKSSRIGLMNYYRGYLGKSSVYAAYAALGVLPLLSETNPSNADGCVDGKTYLSAKNITERTNIEFLQEIVTNARAWYAKHSLPRTAEVYATILQARSQIAC